MSEAKQETKKHILMVQSMLRSMIFFLQERLEIHDLSKLESPEAEIFEEYTSKLKGTTYGSDEYKRYLEEMKPALYHHYQFNRHHPEHFVNGVDGMNILDFLEMFCDWKAATLRHADGNLSKSIEINAKRFNISPQLVSILKNSVILVEGADATTKD